MSQKHPITYGKDERTEFIMRMTEQEQRVELIRAIDPDLDINDVINPNPSNRGSSGKQQHGSQKGQNGSKRRDKESESVYQSENRYNNMGGASEENYGLQHGGREDMDESYPPPPQQINMYSMNRDGTLRSMSSGQQSIAMNRFGTRAIPYPSNNNNDNIGTDYNEEDDDDDQEGTIGDGSEASTSGGGGGGSRRSHRQGSGGSGGKGGSDSKLNRVSRVSAPLQTDRYGFIQSTPNVNNGGDDQDLNPNNDHPEKNQQQLGTISTGVPPDIIRKREMKWIHMLDHWSVFMDKRYDKVRERCRKGIPPSVRGRAWKYLSGAAHHMDNPQSRNAYDELSIKEGNQKWLDDIRKDLDRQFPEHELFARQGPYGEAGQDDLFNLLKAYTILHPEEGYCQGQAPVAATLLMHMPCKDAFYTFVQICHKYLQGYYADGLEAIKLDGAILQEILHRKLPATYKHLKKQSVDPALYMVEWFMCIYCRTLPWSTVLRIWDMFFCEGVKILFKVALVIFKYTLGEKEQLKRVPDLMDIVQQLRRLPPNVTHEDFLIPKMDEIKLEEEELERIHFKLLKKMKAEKRAAGENR